MNNKLISNLNYKNKTKGLDVIVFTNTDYKEYVFVYIKGYIDDVRSTEVINILHGYRIDKWSKIVIMLDSNFMNPSVLNIVNYIQNKILLHLGNLVLISSSYKIVELIEIFGSIMNVDLKHIPTAKYNIAFNKESLKIVNEIMKINIEDIFSF